MVIIIKNLIMNAKTIKFLFEFIELAGIRYSVNDRFICIKLKNNQFRLVRLYFSLIAKKN